jgi:hypothetical protein
MDPDPDLRKVVCFFIMFYLKTCSESEIDIWLDGLQADIRPYFGKHRDLVYIYAPHPGSAKASGLQFRVQKILGLLSQEQRNPEHKAEVLYFHWPVAYNPLARSVQIDFNTIKNSFKDEKCENANFRLLPDVQKSLVSVNYYWVPKKKPKIKPIDKATHDLADQKLVGLEPIRPVGIDRQNLWKGTPDLDRQNALVGSPDLAAEILVSRSMGPPESVPSQYSGRPMERIPEEMTPDIKDESPKKSRLFTL